MAAVVLRYRRSGRRSGFRLWVRRLRGASGVYVIRAMDSGRALYVGESHSGRLYQTLTRHLQRWTSTQRCEGTPACAHGGRGVGPTYPRDAVKVAVVLTPPAAALREQDRLIARLRPRDNVVEVADAVPF